ncbi:unnamed protein product, partial [Brenthis ino]
MDSKTNLILLTIVICIVATVAQRKTYEGYSVYKLTPRSENDLIVLKNLQKSGVGEFWEDQFYINYEIRFMVPGQNKDKFYEIINKAGIEAKVAIKDMQSAIDAQLNPIKRSAETSFLSMNWNQYHSLEEIYDWLDEVERNYSNVVTVVNMGQSVENRTIKGIKINYRPNSDGNNTNKVIGMLQGTLHAREWITASVVTWIIKEFLTSTNTEIRSMAENIEWHLFPVVNPDGYVYTFSTNRMWRKNRSRYNFTSCAESGVSDDMSNGVDLNRNFDFAWMQIGATDDPCSNLFAGPAPSSEPETRAISQYVLNLNNQGRFLYFIDFHSYTQLVVIPYSHVNRTGEMPSNFDDMYQIATNGAEKLKERFGTTYRVGVSADILSSKAYVSYENYKVYKVVPETAKQVQILTDLRKEPHYNFWTDIINIGEDVKIMVSPSQDEELAKYLRSVEMDPVLAISNVQDLIRAQMKPANGISRSNQLGSMNWNQYFTLAQIYAWLDELQNLYPSTVRTVIAGRSNEGRDIKGVIIDFKNGTRGSNPLIGMIEGGIHAREWISPATVTGIIKEFLTSDDADVRHLAETFVWHIFPVINPDGYVYTFSDNRMWRKNRNTAHNTNCSLSNDRSNGIDLNRNFNYLWMTIGASLDACTETFAGPHPASEPETIAISNYVLGLKNSGNLLYYFAFHSYSQMTLIPYSHLSGDRVLEVPNYGDLVNAVSGSSFDWVKGVADVPIVYLFELRDVGDYGFLLPPEEIIPNNEEIMACLVEMDKTAMKLRYYQSAGSMGLASMASLIMGVFCLMIVQ